MKYVTNYELLCDKILIKNFDERKKKRKKVVAVAVVQRLLLLLLLNNHTLIFANNPYGTSKPNLCRSVKGQNVKMVLLVSKSLVLRFDIIDFNIML